MFPKQLAVVLILLFLFNVIFLALFNSKVRYHAEVLKFNLQDEFFIIYEKFTFFTKEFCLFYVFHRVKQFMNMMPLSVFGGIFLTVVLVTNQLLQSNRFTEIIAYSPDILTRFYVAFVLAIILGTIGGRYFFFRMNPKVYSEASLARQTISRGFIYIGYCIWKELLYLKQREEWFEKFSPLEEGEELSSRFHPKINHSRFIIEQCRRVAQKRTHAIERISYLIEFLANKMNLPPKRLSEAVFQFSPSIYLYEYSIIIEKMDFIINNKIHEHKPIIRRRMIEYCFDITRFYNVMSDRRKWQKDIIYFKHLHKYIIGVSKDVGINGALNSFLAGFKAVLFDTKRNGETNDRMILELKFLYHKRLIFPGFDLYILLQNFFYQINYFDVVSSLNELQETKPDRPDPSFGSSKSNYDNLTVISSGLSIIEHFEIVNFTQRMKINTEFINEILEAKSSVLIITRGFSSLVLNSLKKLAEYLGKNIVGHPISLFLLIPENNDESYMTMSRYIHYKFRVEKDLQQLSKGRLDVVFGSCHQLKSQFLNFSGRVLTLSGAELVERKNRGSQVENRVLNTEPLDCVREIFKKPKDVSSSGTRYLGFFSAKAEEKPNQNMIREIILAEPYKIFNEKQKYMSKKGLNKFFHGDHTLHPWRDSHERLIISGGSYEN